MPNFHGPENAEHELRKAYDSVLECLIAFSPPRSLIAGVDPDELIGMYRHAFRRHRDGNRLAAERWARAAKHLARAFWHEAKIRFIEPRTTELPFLEGATPDEYGLLNGERADTVADLLDSFSEDVPPGLDRIPPRMVHYRARGQDHLARLADPEYRHELLRTERIHCAYEYGRVLECMSLAFGAETQTHPRAA
jgi:hypothetical protein